MDDKFTCYRVQTKGPDEYEWYSEGIEYDNEADAKRDALAIRNKTRTRFQMPDVQGRVVRVDVVTTETVIEELP
jgi:hypothetical protein